ncbi:uncharacterized protein LOC129609832 [Condylostylus longicornis]|uniref:uncharacterized protein LOC129609832 n=1 Tax=Condylostylus longicornis TaxID=2530218 RepID=UPI00244E2A09|nr:uncharacterized protein LOC129609832 [Condylostylus longicornis]
MKFFTIFIFAIIGTSLAHKPIEFGIADDVRAAIENVKKQMPCGFPEHGIPPLAPFEHEFQSVELEHDLVSILGNISNVFAIGADNFDIRQCSFSLLKRTLTLELNLNNFHVQRGNYVLDALAFAGNRELTINGAGDVDFSIQNVNLKATAKFGIIGGINLQDFHSTLDVGSVKSQITGLIGGGLPNDVINSVIEELILTTVKDHRAEISEIIKQVAVPLIEKFIKEMKFIDFMDVVTSNRNFYKSSCDKTSIFFY